MTENRWTCRQGQPLPFWKVNEILSTSWNSDHKDIPKPPQLSRANYPPAEVDPREAFATAAAARYIGETGGFNHLLQGLLLLLAAAVGGGVWQAVVEDKASGWGFGIGAVAFFLLAVAYWGLSLRQHRFARLERYADLWQTAAEESRDARAR